MLVFWGLCSAVSQCNTSTWQSTGFSVASAGLLERVWHSSPSEIQSRSSLSPVSRWWPSGWTSASVGSAPGLEDGWECNDTQLRYVHQHRGVCMPHQSCRGWWYILELLSARAIKHYQRGIFQSPHVTSRNIQWYWTVFLAQLAQ